MDLAPLIALLRFFAESHYMQYSKTFIVENLAVLEKLLVDPPSQEFIEDGTLLILQSMATDAQSIISSFGLSIMNQDKAREYLVQLLKLLMPKMDGKDVDQLMNEERPKPSRFYYPKTSPLVFIKNLLEKLDELVDTHPLNFFVSRVQNQLHFWSSRLKGISEPHSNPLYVKNLTGSITNLAYEVEYAIDSFIVGDFPIWHSMFWLLNILKQFEQVEMERLNEDDVVGFGADETMIMHQLCNGQKELCVISIVGAAGQGKTTLAKKLFSSPSVASHFNFRSWCSVSHVYELRDLLLELLGQLIDLSDRHLMANSYELREILYTHFKGRRFLVVLDDMWSLKALNDLLRVFPHDRFGSRIMLTSRMFELAKSSTIFSLSPLSNDDCWKLLRKKLFHDESCPLELEEVGRKIATRCKGLPLSVISTAGILAKKEKTVERWKQIAESLRSHILGDAKAHSMVSLELSYTNLPDHLKSCFLYLGFSLENKESSVSKMIRLWIAEGFIKDTGIKSLEEEAEEYLMNLISRSLVTVGQKSSNGGVKSFRVDDLLYEFCLTKAREDNFLQLINGYEKLLNSSDLDPNPSSTPLIYHQRRLSIHSKRDHFIMLKPSGPFVQSLLFFAVTDTSPSYSYDISFIFHNFKILRTLDFEGINIGDSLKEIDVLVLLRYLAVKSNAECIPSSIANLWNLETFIFKGLRSVVQVPDSVLHMPKLRHVHINNNGASFGMDPHGLENSFILDNLQTFSSPILSYGDDMEKVMRRLRGIRRLKCIFLDSWDDANNCNRFPMLECLNKLESLKVFYNGIGKYPYVFHLPSNLKKLTLSDFRMPWNEISQLARLLCNLEVLKLLSNACKGETWEVKDECFPKLKFLKLENLDFVTWTADEDSFPRLVHLLLHRCKRLEEIPPSFGGISTLDIIEVRCCNSSVVNSTKTILMEQLYYGNEGFKIHIHPT